MPLLHDLALILTAFIAGALVMSYLADVADRKPLLPLAFRLRCRHNRHLSRRHRSQRFPTGRLTPDQLDDLVEKLRRS